MNEKSKAETLIGFAIKAGKVTFGADNIEKSRKNHLIICDKELSENTLKKLAAIAADSKIKLLIAAKPLEQIVFKKNVKAIAVTDRQMSRAITENSIGFSENR